MPADGATLVSTSLALSRTLRQNPRGLPPTWLEHVRDPSGSGSARIMAREWKVGMKFGGNDDFRHPGLRTEGPCTNYHMLLQAWLWILGSSPRMTKCGCGRSKLRLTCTQGERETNASVRLIPLDAHQHVPEVGAGFEHHGVGGEAGFG